MNFSLYSWFGSQYIDSYYPSSIMCIRMLNHMKQNFKVQYLILPEEGKPVDKVLSNFPVLQAENTFGDKEVIYRGINIVEYLLDQIKSTLDLRDEPNYRRITMTEQWARESLSKTMIYFLFYNDDNYEVFRNALVRRFSAGIMTEDKMSAIRSAMLGSLNFSDLKSAEYAKAKDLLFTQFQIVNDLVDRSDYATGPTLKQIDLWLFSFCSVLLLPYNQEANELKEEFPNVVDYLLKIHEETKGEYTGSMDYLKVG